MKNSLYLFIICLLAFSAISCTHITETAKIIWGSSVRALEEARLDAVSAIYQCNFNDCFDEVLKIAEKAEMRVFIRNREKSLIVLMGVPEATDTTEVGVFFLGFGETETKVEIASLSQNAKDKASEIIFSNLVRAFNIIK